MTLTAENNRPVPRSAPESVHSVRGRRQLSSYEECELSALIEGGDRDARDRLVVANLGLVVTIARQFCGRGLELDDLTGEGNLGLIRAAKEFQPRFGTRFSTYAAYWIKQSIRQALINTTATIRLPSHMFGLLTKWRRAEQTLFRQAGRGPSFEEIASYLQLSEVHKSLVAHAQQAGQLRLEANCGGDSRNWLASDLGNRHAAGEDMVEFDDEWLVTLQRMKRLEARELEVLTLRYGLEGEVLTFREIGLQLGITREWVRKLELHALHKLGDNRSDRAFNWQDGSLSQLRRRGGNAAPAKAKSVKSSPRKGNSGDLTLSRRKPV
jgi:RNA polymerase primary sigma factor